MFPLYLSLDYIILSIDFFIFYLESVLAYTLVFKVLALNPHPRFLKLKSYLGFRCMSTAFILGTQTKKPRDSSYK